MTVIGNYKVTYIDKGCVKTADTYYIGSTKTIENCTYHRDRGFVIFTTRDERLPSRDITVFEIPEDSLISIERL